MDIKQLRQKSLKLPLLPGVYIMKNAVGKIIYIGKAKALKNRVSQYFTNLSAHTEKVRQMVLNVDDFEYIICESEFEALILENSLIKQNQPKYNILLKDDKGFHYIHISDEEFPKITAEKQKLSGGRNIGPYNSGYIVTSAVEEAKKAFGLPLCKKTFHKGQKRTRPCLNYHIGQCRGMCAGKMTYDEYMTATENAITLIKNGESGVINSLRTQMQTAAENLEFEKAAYLRDRINAIEKISEKQKVMLENRDDMDIIAGVDGSKNACFEVFRYRDGVLYDREHFFVSAVSGVANSLSEFIVRYYSMRENIPKTVIVGEYPDDREPIEQFLTDKAGRKVGLFVAQRGELKNLFDMCRYNCAERVAQKEGSATKTTAALSELKSLLKLESIPEYIEAYDISHTGGADTVGGMIVFKNGKPYKTGYRKFALDGVGNDDYTAMNNVIFRRFNEYLKLKDTDDYFGKLPDLILLDGGAGQLSAVTAAFDAVGVSVAVYGMVKDSKHRTRALVGFDGEIQIKASKSVFSLVTAIQDEVHRFAIGYHRTRHKNRTLALSLNQIDGIGKTRAENLLKHFGDINKIAAASIDELKSVSGMTEKTAQAVYDFYRN